MITAAAILVHGYHLGIEDQAIYLPGVEKSLHPNLFARDAELFLPQTRPTLMVTIVAVSVRLTGMSIESAVFAWHFLSLFLLLLASWRLVSRCFAATEARWGGVTLLAALLTMPVAGTSIYLADQYLHPRTLATAWILLAVVEMLDRRIARAVLWIALAALIHIQMAFYGALLCSFLLWKPGWRPGGKSPDRQGGTSPSAAGSLTALTFPLQSLFQPGSEAWKEAARTREGHYLQNWQWYEWMGVIGPLLLFWWFVKLARRASLDLVAFLSQRVAAFQIFSTVSALIITLPPRFERLTPYQPMRTVHVTTLIFILLAGGFIGQFLLRRSAVRWVLLFVPLCGAMFYAQRQLFPASEHLEMPGHAPRNPWVQAFLWVKDNTPDNAYFALDPKYVELPGEDQHGFRAFSQRSMMADWAKDGGVALLFPAMAERWREETHARANWSSFTSADFLHLREQYGVDWVVLEKPMRVALPCPYENARVAVCRIGN